MQLGIDSFAAAPPNIGTDSGTGTINGAEAMRELLERVERADQVGLDVFGIGEHHRKEFLDSAPAVLLVVVADGDILRDLHVLVHDGAANARVPADVHPGEEERRLDVRVAVDADVGRQHAVARGSHVLEVLGFPPTVRAVLANNHPRQRRLPHWPFFYKVVNGELAKRLRPEDWYVCGLDGDTSL